MSFADADRDLAAARLSERVAELLAEASALVERYINAERKPPWPQTASGRDLEYGCRSLRLAELQLKQAERHAREAAERDL